MPYSSKDTGISLAEPWKYTLCRTPEFVWLSPSLDSSVLPSSAEYIRFSRLNAASGMDMVPSAAPGIGLRFSDQSLTCCPTYGSNSLLFGGLGHAAGPIGGRTSRIGRRSRTQYSGVSFPNFTRSIRTYIHTYIRTYIHTYTYIHKYIHTYIHPCIRAYIHTYIHTCMHTDRHTCVHT